MAEINGLKNAQIRNRIVSKNNANKIKEERKQSILQGAAEGNSKNRLEFRSRRNRKQKKKKHP